MSERFFWVRHDQPSDDQPVQMTEEELRQTYPYLADVVDLDAFRYLNIAFGSTQIEIGEAVEPANQHVLP